MYGGRGIYGGCTGDVRLDIVRIPCRYRADITEPLPLEVPVACLARQLSGVGLQSVLNRAAISVKLRDASEHTFSQNQELFV